MSEEEHSLIKFYYPEEQETGEEYLSRGDTSMES